MTDFTTNYTTADFLSQNTTNVDDNTTTTTIDETRTKHLLLEVPSYENQSPKNYSDGKSYLEMGNCDGKGMRAPWAGAGLLAGNHAFSAAADGADLLSTDVWGGEFIDDKRNRGTGSNVGGSFYKASTAFNSPTQSTENKNLPGATPPNEAVSRAKGAYSAPGTTTGTTEKNALATSLIPAYVGWRDHTDGHRITTTRGDKIEIIGGNYKIVSLGRGTGVASYEMSGGIIVDAMEAPGNVTSITWRECPTEDLKPGPDTIKKSGWKVVSQTVKGNEVTRYHGTQREEFYGDELISVTGSPKPLPTSAEREVNTNTDGEHAYLGDWAPPDPTLGSKGSTEHSDAAGYMGFGSAQDELGFMSNTKAYPTKWDRAGGGAPPNLPCPDIYESTWAKSITSYTKAYGKVTEEEYYKEGKETHTYLGDGESYTDYFHMLGALGHFEYFHGAKTEFFFGASTTVGLANRFEFFMGLEEQFNLGVIMEVQIGPQIENSVGPELEFKLGGKFLGCIAPKVDANLSQISNCLNETQNAVLDLQANVAEASSGLFEKMLKLNCQIG